MCWELLTLLFVGGLVANLEDGFGDALISALAYVVAWGIPVWVALLTLYSIDRYGKIELTRAPPAKVRSSLTPHRPRRPRSTSP